MAVIEIPDDQAAALRAKAAAQGLTLEAWFKKLSAVEPPIGRGRSGKSRYSLAELLAQCDRDALLSAEDREWLDLPSVGREA